MLWSVSRIQQMTINIIYYIRWVCIWFTTQWGVTKGFWAEELYVSSWNSTVNNLSMKLQFSSVAQLCLTLCHPMDCSTPGFPVLHRLPEFVQTRVRWVSDDIQTSHPLSSPHLRKIVLGLPWWSSGKESTFKCRGCGFNPWLRNWNPTRCRATKPAYHNYWTCMLQSLYSATGESLYATTKT